VDVLHDPVVVWTARLLLAAVFAGAAVAKLRAREEFAGVVANYRLLPDALARGVAFVLPPLELVLAAGLLMPVASAWAAGAGALLLAAFGLAMAVNLVRGRRDIDCGCFASALRQRLTWGLVARNGALAASAWVVFAGPASRPAAWPDLVTAGCASAALIFLYAAYSRLAGLAPGGRGVTQGAS
jgi:hypothetical protein